MLASLAAGERRGGMRELDPEAPVVWPAWCYAGEGGGNVGVRKGYAGKGATPPAPPAPQPPLVKNERLSPNDNRSSASRSRSVTPSTSSYPGTPPERPATPPGHPAHPAHPPHPAHPAHPAHPGHAARNYSDIMRSLAARYNSSPVPHNEYYQGRVNGFGGLLVKGEARSPAREPLDQPVGGLFAALALQPALPQRFPAFPLVQDMSTTKTLVAIARTWRCGRTRRRSKRSATSEKGPDHSPLDLSAAGDTAAKRQRLSETTSPSPSDGDDRRSDSGAERTCGTSLDECGGTCSGTCSRVAAWTVDDVCDFVHSIDICAEYTTNFREQRIDGSGLPLLTEDHLTGMLQMKLGPALKLKALLAKKLSSCDCQMHTALKTERLNGTPQTVFKTEPNSNCTSPS